MVLKENVNNPDQPLAALEACWLWASQEHRQRLMMFGLGACGTWIRTDSSSPMGHL